MKADVNNVYIVSPAELTLIAAAKNMDNIFAIYNTNEEMNEDRVCLLLNHLYQEEFIENPDGEGFVLQEGLRELVEGIERAKAVMLIRHYTKLFHVKTIYIGKRLVALEQRESDMSAVRIYEIPKEELRNFVEDDFKVKERPYHNILNEEEVVSEGMKKKGMLSEEDVNSIGNVDILVEKMTPHRNKILCRMIERKGNQWLRYVQGETEVENLDQEEFMVFLEDLIKEE